MSMRCVYVSELWSPAGLLLTPTLYMSVESHGGMILTGETEERRENNLFHCQFVYHKLCLD
jgi:hypothetical protein